MKKDVSIVVPVSSYCPQRSPIKIWTIQNKSFGAWEIYKFYQDNCWSYGKIKYAVS